MATFLQQIDTSLWWDGVLNGFISNNGAVLVQHGLLIYVKAFKDAQLV